MVTGATGFLGAHLVRALALQGALVVGVSRRDVASSDRLSYARVDLTDIDQVRRTLGQLRPDCVFHLSSLADGRPDLALVAPIMQAEVVATVNVLTVAAEQRIARVVLPASLEEVEPGATPHSPYAAAKTTTALYARMFSSLYGLPVVSARVFMAYGPGQPSWKLIPAVVLALLRGESPVVHSPDRLVDWIYVSDVIDGLLRVGAAEGVEGQVIDLGSGELVSIRMVVETIERLIGCGPRARYATACPRNERVVKANLTAAMERLHWAPRVSLQDGLALTIDALKAHTAGK